MFKTILVPTDGSPESDKAINAAIEVARQSGGRIIGLSVSEPYPFSPVAESVGTYPPSYEDYEKTMRERAQQHVARIVDAAKAANVPCEPVVAESFDPSDEIIRTATDHGCDVIFMASHGTGGLRRLFVGSQTQKVLAHSAIPVMVFR